MKKILTVGLAVFSVLALADAHWSVALNGTGTGSSRYVAETSAKNNLQLDVSQNSEACTRQGGTPSVDTDPDSHCEQFYPVGNWRCVVDARFTCTLP